MFFRNISFFLFLLCKIFLFLIKIDRHYFPPELYITRDHTADNVSDSLSRTYMGVGSFHVTSVLPMYTYLTSLFLLFVFFLFCLLFFFILLFVLFYFCNQHKQRGCQRQPNNMATNTSNVASKGNQRNVDTKVTWIPKNVATNAT